MTIPATLVGTANYAYQKGLLELHSTLSELNQFDAFALEYRSGRDAKKDTRSVEH
ncbi:MAG: hypothetical protein ACJAZF_001766 [Granulosicoccus sp.]|jgi:hypothetical protein